MEKILSSLQFYKTQIKTQRCTILNREVKLLKFNDIGIRKNVGKQEFPCNVYVFELV